MSERPAKLWEALKRWERFHPIVAMFVASRAVRTRGSIDWIDRADRTPLAKHCADSPSVDAAWATIPLSERRDILKTARLPGVLANGTWDDVALAFAALVEEDRRGDQWPEPVELTMSIPDALLAWADAEQLAWVRPWATEVREILAKEPPLDVDDTTMLLNRLDPIVSHAAQARRSDLLVGFDTVTADMLGLVFEFESVHGKIIIGRSGSWNYDEVDTVMGADEPKGALAVAVQAKELLAEIFPGTRISAISRDEEAKCSTCGNPLGAVSVSFETSTTCRRCWTQMTSPTPPHIIAILRPPEKKSKTTKQTEAKV